ncbi:MAG: chromosome segregation SMC family protein [Clostridia bacterium]
MELKRVEMLGFKSFPEKISVEFDRGITAIVGPNGSGKSNISDAVRWVLGEQSARTLRGAKMEDVIFAGTQRRRPVNYAQVTLVLDNSDKKIPIEYDEVSISRRVYRSGESEYTVNQNRCRLKDVQELLMDTGIGKDGYSVIGQGQIDQLLSTKPQERRLIFEEAAGIVKYKTRKETAIKELEEERANLNRVQDILEEIASRLGPLQEQAEVAQKYVKLKDELKIYEINAFLGQYKQYREQYQRLLSQQEDLGRQMEASRQEQEEAKARSAQYAAAAQQVQQTLSQMYDEMTQMKVRKETAEGNRRVDQQKKEYLRKELEGAQKRLDETKSKLSARAATVRKEEERREQLSQDLNLRENRMALLSEAEKIYRRKHRRLRLPGEAYSLVERCEDIAGGQAK